MFYHISLLYCNYIHLYARYRISSFLICNEIIYTFGNQKLAFEQQYKVLKLDAKCACKTKGVLVQVIFSINTFSMNNKIQSLLCVLYTVTMKCVSITWFLLFYFCMLFFLLNCMY